MALRVVLYYRPGDVEEIAQWFRGARRTEVEKHLQTLDVLGVVWRDGDAKWKVHGGVDGGLQRQM